MSLSSRAAARPVDGHEALAEDQLVLQRWRPLSSSQRRGAVVARQTHVPRRPSGDAGNMTPRRRRCRAVVMSVLLHLLMSWWSRPQPSSWRPPLQGIVALLRCCVVVVVVAGPHRLHCRHRPCLHHYGSRSCCPQRRRCSPQLKVGCCVTYSVVCCPICHPPLSSYCDRQQFCHRPPSPIVDFCQPLFYCSCPGHPSPLPLPLMVGCCVLSPPSRKPAEPPS